MLPSIVVGDITELSISAMSIAPLERWSHESFSDSEKQIGKVSLIFKTILERERKREREREREIENTKDQNKEQN